MRVQLSLTSVPLFDLPRVVEVAGKVPLDALHIDVSDGRFSPESALPTVVAAAVARLSALPVEVHLMVENPESYFDDLAAAGVARVGFHLEAAPYPLRTINAARSVGLGVTLALNPRTGLDGIDYLLSSVDRVSLLTTEPDRDGEQFIAALTPRIVSLGRLLSESPGGPVGFQVDGGVGAGQAALLRNAGVTDVVVGRALLSGDGIDRRRLDEFR
jgi:ribulose-phosphate 3-epimerase